MYAQKDNTLATSSVEKRVFRQGAQRREEGSEGKEELLKVETAMRDYTGGRVDSDDETRHRGGGVCYRWYLTGKPVDCYGGGGARIFF